MFTLPINKHKSKPTEGRKCTHIPSHTNTSTLNYKDEEDTLTRTDTHTQTHTHTHTHTYTQFSVYVSLAAAMLHCVKSHVLLGGDD